MNSVFRIATIKKNFRIFKNPDLRTHKKLLFIDFNSERLVVSKKKFRLLLFNKCIYKFLICLIRSNFIKLTLKVYANLI